MTAINEWDRADRYEDGRTVRDDADMNEPEINAGQLRAAARPGPIPPPCPDCQSRYGHDLLCRMRQR